MAMTKAGNIPGPIGIPNASPVDTAQGGPEGVGGAANTVNPPRVKATEPAGGNTPGAGANTNLFGSFTTAGDHGSTSQANQGPSNVNEPYPTGHTHPVSGTPLPSSPSETPGGTGRVMRGGRGGR